MIVFPTTTPTLAADAAAVARLKQRVRRADVLLRPACIDDAGRLDDARAGGRRNVRRRARGSRAADGAARISCAARRRREPDVASATAKSCRIGRTERSPGSWSRRRPPGISWRSSTMPCPWSTSRTCWSRPAAAVRTRATSASRPSTRDTSSASEAPRTLVDEIERCHRELGVDFFYLWGDTVTLNVKSFTAFCDELIARKLPIQWFGNARADNLTDPAFVHRLKRAGAGCSRSVSSPNPKRSARTWRSGWSARRFRPRSSNMREAGIKSFAFFIFGYPGETVQSARRDDALRDRARSGLCELLSRGAVPRDGALRQVHPRRMAEAGRRRLDEDGVLGTICCAATASTSESSWTPSTARSAGSS